MREKLIRLKERRTRPIWLTIYTDLMTNLMLFFLMLFGIGRLTPEMKQQMIKSLEDEFGQLSERLQIQTVVKKEEDMNDMLEKFIDKEGIQNFADVEIDEKKVRIMFSEPILFDLGKAILKNKARAVLSEVSDLIKNIPNQIIVEGHTDNMPILHGPYRSNWELSMARSLSVVEYFTKGKNISPERFAAAGYGEYRPLQPNDTPEHRALNRRIEITIVRIQ